MSSLMVSQVVLGWHGMGWGAPTWRRPGRGAQVPPRHPRLPPPTPACSAVSKLQLHITISNTSGKKILLWMGGESSLAPRADGFTGGRVTVKGRGPALPVIASFDAGIKQAEAVKENLVSAECSDPDCGGGFRLHALRCLRWLAGSDARPHRPADGTHPLCCPTC